MLYKKIPAWVWIPSVYALIRLPALTLLPVFADEAIYIRWAQLIQDDAPRYLFFSMADGKPPLFIWILSVMLHFFGDPLVAGRVLSVLIGFCTVLIIRHITKQVSDDKLAVELATVCAIIVPFFFFHQRMALMDGLLTLLIGCAFSAAIGIAKKIHEGKVLHEFFWLLPAVALSFAGALMTKLPALFAIPTIALVPVFFFNKRNVTSSVRAWLFIGIAGLVGCVLFLLLRISPLFGALFTRSGDFSFTTKQLLSGEWRYVLFASLPRTFTWISTYMTPTLLVCALGGLVYEKTRKVVAVLLLGAIVFCAPLQLIGRVLWPRYFLPSALFFTVAGAIGGAALYADRKYKTFTLILFALLVLRSFMFMVPSWTQIQSIPFVEADRLQYLEEWSAGFGNTEVTEYVLARRALSSIDTQKFVLLTEGSFGTLPDGILMYFHKPGKARNIEIQGIGLDVKEIPSAYRQRAASDEVYYAVNSDRLKLLSLDSVSLVFEVPRPGGKSLQLYRVKPEPNR